MTRVVPRRAGLILACAVVLSALSGCSSFGGQISLEEALEDRGEVRALTQDLAAAAESVGLEPFFAYGDWTTCTDRGSKWQYNGMANLHAEGASADDLEAVLAALTEQVGLTTAGPGTFGQDTIADGQARGLDVRIRSNTDGPEFFISVSGPCVRVPDALADHPQGGTADQILDIGGTHPNQQDAVP